MRTMKSITCGVSFSRSFITLMEWWPNLLEEKIDPFDDSLSRNDIISQVMATTTTSFSIHITS